MRRGIETAPMDGQVIILEDDASGTYDVAHWSPEAGKWLGENGEPSKIRPTHWYPMQGDDYLSLNPDGSSGPSHIGPPASRLRRYAIPAVLVVAAVIGTYFHAEVAAFVTQYAGQPNVVGDGTIGKHGVAQETGLPGKDSQETSLPPLRQQAEADRPAAPAAVQATVQDEQVADAPVAEARQSPDQEQRAEALAQELAGARRAIAEFSLQQRTEAEKAARSLGQEHEKAAAFAQEAAAARQELTANAEQHRHAIEEERARGVALARDLAAARREIDTQGALLRKANDEAVQFRQAAESAAAELRQALQQERDKAEAMARDLESARRMMERKADDEAAQLTQAETATAELRQALQQERSKTEAMALDLESMRRTMDAHVMPERAASGQIAQVTQVAEAVAPEQPAAAEAQGSPEATRLIARASALLGQGNIGAARIVLERAAEAGSAQANFMLAETYDPVILSAWGTYGTRGEAAKARELYSKAHAGGIQEAKDRSNALR